MNHKGAYLLLHMTLLVCCFLLGLFNVIVLADTFDLNGEVPSVLDANFSANQDKQDNAIDSAVQNLISSKQTPQEQSKDTQHDTQTQSDKEKTTPQATPQQTTPQQATPQQATPQQPPKQATPQKALWAQILADRYKKTDTPSTTGNTNTSTNIVKPINSTKNPLQSKAEQKSDVEIKKDTTKPSQTKPKTDSTADSNSGKTTVKQTTSTKQTENTSASKQPYVDKPTKEEIQLAIDSFRDDDSPFFDRYRIRSRNGVVDSPENIIGIDGLSSYRKELTLVQYAIINRINLIKQSDFQMPEVRDKNSFTLPFSDMIDFLDIDLHTNIVNYMISKDMEKWLEELDDSSIGYVPNYNGPKDSIWLSWIWGAITIGVILFIVLIIVLYQVIKWFRLQEYNEMSISHSEDGTNVLMPTTEELYSNVYTPRSDDTVSSKSPYGGLEIFMDRRIEE